MTIGRVEYEAPEDEVRLSKVVSGGQTGVDRAALDAAMDAGLSVGGWCPRGRRAEDGVISDTYPLQETPSEAYVQRTSWNVRDSDATLIVAGGDPVGGTALTVEEARRQGRAVRVVSPERKQVGPVLAWLAVEGIRTLNVAGPRETTEPGIYAKANAYLRELFEAARG